MMDDMDLEEDIEPLVDSGSHHQRPYDDEVDATGHAGGRHEETPTKPRSAHVASSATGRRAAHTPRQPKVSYLAIEHCDCDVCKDRLQDYTAGGHY